MCKKILLIGDYKILKKFKIIFWGEGNLVLNWKNLWGIWVYTWVRCIVIPGLGLFVCLFVVWGWVYPFFFGGVPPSLPAFSSWAVRSLPPVRPRGGRVGFLPASGSRRSF
jgi:hypothetical protein